jgi:RNA-directed DNA polymerase
MVGLERWTPTTDTPQGAVLSPLLANTYLHSLDKLITEQNLYFLSPQRKLAAKY